MASLDTSAVLGNLTVSNKINAKKILSNKSVVISDDNAADHNLYRVMDLSSTLHLIDGGLQQQVIDGKYVPYVLTKVIKNGDQSTTFECDHESEIVGGSNHNFGTITDETTMKITKVQGQTRRYSLNLMNYNFSGTNNGITYTTDENGVITLNGTATGTANIYRDGLTLPAGKYTFAFVGNTNSNISYIINQVGTFTGNFVKSWQYPNSTIYGFSLSVKSGTVLNNFKLYPMLVEGTYTADTMPPFQPYDDTLVNSKCNLISTGRNLFNSTTAKDNTTFTSAGVETSSQGFVTSDYISVIPNSKYYLNVLTVAVGFDNNKQSLGYLSNMSINNAITIPNNCYFIKVRNFSSNSNIAELKETASIVYGETAPTEYEPYTKEEIPLDIELGAYDYIDVENDLIRRQTSKIFTISGSSNEKWGIAPTVISGIKRFSLDIRSIGASTSPSDEYAYIINASNWIDVTSNDTNTLNKCEGIAAQGNAFFIRKDDITTVASLRSWLQSNPIQIAYKLTNYNDEPYKANQLLMATTNNTLALYNKYDIIKKENIKHDYGLMFEDNTVKNLVEAETIEISTSGTTEINLDELPIIDFVKVYAGKHFTKIEKTDPIIFSFKRVGGGMFGENDYIQLCQMSLYTYSDKTAKRKLRKLGETKIDSSANTTGLFDFSTTYNELNSMLAHNNAENVYYFRVCRKDDNTNFKHSNKIMKFIHINTNYVPNGVETSVSVQ